VITRNAPAGVETSTLADLPFPVRRAALAPRFRVGDRVAGRFRVRRFLGQGGMAQVYEAEDLELGQSVAIKALRSDLARDSPAAKLLKTEVLLARRVTHPNVCRIFDVFHHPATGGDSASGDLWIVAMELLRGETLAARLRRGPLTSEEALPLVRQMAEGLAAAHAAGVAHLDLKSANVILVPEREGTRAVLTDFGLARSTDLPDATTWSKPSPRGTPAYMAPEQVSGGPVSAAADLYALGVVLYEMVTGRLPFRGETPRATAEKRLTERPLSPRTYAPELDPRWEQAILRCLERNPQRRFSSALDLAAALDPGRPASRSFHWPRVGGLCLILGLLAVLGAFPPVPLTGGAVKPTPSWRGTTSARNLYERGLAALQESEARAATRLLERALAVDPSFGLAHSALADAWWELGYQTRARRQSRLALDLAKDLPREERLWVEARYHHFHGQWDAALQRYEALWTFFPDKTEYGLRLAAAQVAAGQTEASLTTLAALRQASRSAPADPRIDLAEAKAAQARADFQSQFAAASRAAQQAEASVKWRIQGQGLHLQGAALRQMREFDRAREAQMLAKAAFLKGGDRAGVASAVYELGATSHYALKFPEAERMLSEALAIFRGMGDRGGEGRALLQLARLAETAARYDDIRPHLDAALAVFQEVGDPRGEELARTFLAERLQAEGRFRESAQQLERNLNLVRTFDDRQREAYVLMVLAVAVQHWDLGRSLQLLQEARSIYSQVADPVYTAEIARRLGTVMRESGDLRGAEPVLTEAQRGLQALGARQFTALAQIQLAQLYISQGRLDTAAELATVAIRAFDPQVQRTRAGVAWTVLADALHQQGKRKEAEDALERARAVMPEDMIPADGVMGSIMQARLLHALGRPVEAEDLLARAEARAAAMHSDLLRIEAGLVRALFTAGPRSTGKSCDGFIALEAEARAHHFGLLATKAAAAKQNCQQRL
jgi:tetratricopeptide (TPR) repeat protein